MLEITEVQFVIKEQVEDKNHLTTINTKRFKNKMPSIEDERVPVPPGGQQQTW